MSLLLFALTFVVERRPLLPRPPSASASRRFAYVLFGMAAQAPLPRGLLWF